MVKSKRDLKSPRRRVSLTKLRPISKARPTSSVSIPTGSGANIKVIVRVRPPNAKENGDNYRTVVKRVDDQMLIFDPKEDEQPFFYHGVQQKSRDLLRKANKHLQFMFDKVFGYDVDNENVFMGSTYSLVNSLMDGFNCSVFAYGATGAGKTHTMIGNTVNPGITFLTMAELFRKKDELSVDRDFEIGITYLEVYNELVQDLFNPGPALHLREDNKYGVMVAGIKLHKIEHPQELFSLLEEGNKNRTQHPTDANAESSRSHAVFQVYLQMRIRSTGEMRTAKLSMIDLAGSERGSATGCAGARFTEGANINKSLLALGNCINSLADGHRHVPYRDSKLTRLLKDSLGGNCQTVMIANVSPSSLSYEDTYNTLKYATRAKKIKSNMKRNVVNVEMHVGQYVKMVEELKKENAVLKRQLHEEKIKASNVPGLEDELNKLKTKLSQSCHVGTETNLDPVLIEELQSTFEEKKKLWERKFQIEISELGMNLRRTLKEEADARLSDICTGTPEKKTDAHRRLGNIVDRFQRKENALKDELSTIQTMEIALNDKITDLLTKHPRLQSIVNLENEKLTTIDYKYKLEFEQKQSEVLRDENLSKCILLGKMSRLLRPCFMQLRGHGFASQMMMKEYNELVKDCEGRKNIKWDDNIGDSGLSSATSLDTDDADRENKRRIGESVQCEDNSTTSLDSTFVLTPNKPKVKLRAENLMAKVHRAPPPKRLINKTNVSPRPKEIKAPRRPLSTITSSTRMALTSTKGDLLKSTRPPFRR